MKKGAMVVWEKSIYFRKRQQPGKWPEMGACWSAPGIAQWPGGQSQELGIGVGEGAREWGHIMSPVWCLHSNPSFTTLTAGLQIKLLSCYCCCFPHVICLLIPNSYYKGFQILFEHGQVGQLKARHLKTLLILITQDNCISSFSISLQQPSWFI